MLNASSVGAMAGPDNEHLAAMRKEYGSKERDGSPDLDIDWLDDGWLPLLRSWIGEAERVLRHNLNSITLIHSELFPWKSSCAKRSRISARPATW